MMSSAPEGKTRKCQDYHEHGEGGGRKKELSSENLLQGDQNFLGRPPTPSTRRKEEEADERKEWRMRDESRGHMATTSRCKGAHGFCA